MEELRKELVNALNKRVKCEERVKEFFNPMFRAWNEGQIPKVPFESLVEYEKINREFEEALKEYNTLFRKYVKRNNSSP